MYREYDYRPTAIAHEQAFRLILEREGIKFNPTDSIDHIYSVMSTGDRFEKNTIYNFEKLQDDLFQITTGDFGFMSGGGQSINWKIENNRAVYVGIESCCMS